MTAFVEAGAPIRLADRDTLFGRSGARVWGAHYLHDGVRSLVRVQPTPLPRLSVGAGERNCLADLDRG